MKVESSTGPWLLVKNHHVCLHWLRHAICLYRKSSNVEIGAQITWKPKAMTCTYR